MLATASAEDSAAVPSASSRQPADAEAAEGRPAASPQDNDSVCVKHLKKMEAQGYWCEEELKTLPEDYGSASMYLEHRYLPEDYSESPAKNTALTRRPDGTIWSADFNHSSSLSIGDVQKQLPKPDKLKDLVKYKGPFKQNQVLKQATVNAELQKAIESGDSDMVAALLRFGMMKRCVNVNAPLWPKRERMLHLAARKDYRDICVMLLEAKAELDCEEITDGRHPLHDACSCGSYDVVELLLDKRARVEENTFTGMRPIHWAASRGHKDVVDLLLDRKASIHSTSSDTKEALHHAASAGHAEVVRLLCKRGSKVNAETNNFQRPIHLACVNGHLKAAAVLMDFGSLGVLDDKGALQKYQGTPIEEFMRTVEQLRFQRDEAEELYDMGQEEDAQEAFRRLVAGYVELGLIESGRTAHAEAGRIGVELEPFTF
eukprot:CAMPEP_0204606872 /NCGR_PEP_ID=MMETSP0661-20131031/59348_1 /ASSEMBLY_ACC=CAM_ASM_000606 /TAXON_ID=109239 /ORGANISM="Alexandrium margalefi, Strain AMGDE01CS-322" /LENGTH=430 /DNA_ID=CAMNT_0051618231 /DNA_START=33 /DNA_END=1325 /DNA_ORIENTATION=-